MKLTEKGAYKKLQHSWNHLIRLENEHRAEAGGRHLDDDDPDGQTKLIDECPGCSAFYAAYLLIMGAQDRLWKAMGKRDCAPA